MKHKVSVEGAIRFTKLSVYLAYTWPPSINATEWEFVKNDIAILLSSLSVLFFLIPVLALPIVRKGDSVTLTDSMMFTIAYCNYVIKTRVYKVRRKQIQILTYEMENYVKNPRSHEKAVLQFYLDRCWMFHVLVTMTLLLAVITIIVAPLISDRLLPVDAFYPFTLGAGLVLIDCQMAVMMWYASARIEMLAEEIKSVTNVREFQCIVRKHQRLLAYAIEISDTMSYIALVTTVSSGLGIILCCIQIVNKDQPLSTKTNYGPGIVVFMMNLFISAWPAENLLHVATYATSWMDMSAKWMKNYLFILRRSHRPVKVSVAGFIPTLSFNFYRSFLSAAFSYVTTLRAVMSMNSEN